LTLSRCQQDGAGRLCRAVHVVKQSHHAPAAACHTRAGRHDAAEREVKTPACQHRAHGARGHSTPRSRSNRSAYESHAHSPPVTGRERERDRDIETDRQTDRQREREMLTVHAG